MTLHTRKSHFLGTKLRALRKRNRLTLDELSVRCAQLDARCAPSVSYLSMIESGKRRPSEEVLKLLSALFQRDAGWFADFILLDVPVARSFASKNIAWMTKLPGGSAAQPVRHKLTPGHVPFRRLVCRFQGQCFSTNSRLLINAHARSTMAAAPLAVDAWECDATACHSSWLG